MKKILMYGLLLMIMSVASLATGEFCEYSSDGNLTWVNFTFINPASKIALEPGLDQDTNYCVRCKNDSTDFGYQCKTTKEGLDTVWVLAALLGPILLAFLFIYVANSIQSKDEGNEHIATIWFFRLLAVAMIIPFAFGVSIVANESGRYPSMVNFLSWDAMLWIFYTFMALFCIWFMFKLFKALQLKKEHDRDNELGEL